MHRTENLRVSSVKYNSDSTQQHAEKRKTHSLMMIGNIKHGRTNNGRFKVEPYIVGENWRQVKEKKCMSVTFHRAGNPWTKRLAPGTDVAGLVILEIGRKRVLKNNKKLQRGKLDPVESGIGASAAALRLYLH